jgi:hypothetical protein
MTSDCTAYLFKLSDEELILWWQAFGTYPTHDRRQRRRLVSLVGMAVLENVPELMSIRERQRVGEPVVAAEPRKVNVA